MSDNKTRLIVAINQNNEIIMCKNKKKEYILAMWHVKRLDEAKDLATRISSRDNVAIRVAELVIGDILFTGPTNE